MAVAFITTLWGAFLANFLFQPIAARLKKLSADEVAYRELVIEGVLAVQSGANPRALAGKLVTFLPPNKRDEVLEKQSA
jgi:chemotaxis protein MotA